MGPRWPLKHLLTEDTESHQVLFVQQNLWELQEQNCRRAGHQNNSQNSNIYKPFISHIFYLKFNLKKCWQRSWGANLKSGFLISFFQRCVSTKGFYRDQNDSEIQNCSMCWLLHNHHSCKQSRMSTVRLAVPKRRKKFQLNISLYKKGLCWVLLSEKNTYIV